MRKKTKILLTSILFLFAVLISGCGQAKESANIEKNTTSKEKEITKTGSEQENSKKIVKTSFEEIEGYWNGNIGNVSIHLFEGKTGEINLLDNHSGANLIFNDYKSKDSALEFEIDPSTFGYENFDPFSLTIQKFEDETIDMTIGDISHSFKKISEDEYYKESPEEYFGDKAAEATEAQLGLLQEEMLELTDKDIEIGTLTNEFDYTNRVFTYLIYNGKSDSDEDIRGAILKKIIEMNKVADKYSWLDRFVVNAYLYDNESKNEREKQTNYNVLTPYEVNNDDFAFKINTSPEDRWVMSKKEISTDILAGFVGDFAGNEQLLTKMDERLVMRYPLYNAENPLTVLFEAFTTGLPSHVQNEFDQNKDELESTMIKEMIGYWHYLAMNQYYEITFDELNGGMVRITPNVGGYSFKIKNETSDSIEITVANGETWTLKRSGNELYIDKNAGNDITLNLSSKEETEKKN